MELYVCFWYLSKSLCFPFKLTQISTWFQFIDTNCLEIKKINWDGSDVKFRKKSEMFKCYRHKGMIEGKFRGNNHFWTNPQSFILSGFTKIDACGTAFYFFSRALRHLQVCIWESWGWLKGSGRCWKKPCFMLAFFPLMMYFSTIF